MMRVLMLGWEYPPHISGGLGTACEGLTIALAHQGTNVFFVVPYLVGDESAPHMRLFDSSGAATGEDNGSGEEAFDLVEGEFFEARGAAQPLRRSGTESVRHQETHHRDVVTTRIKKTVIPAHLKPYWGEAEYAEFTRSIRSYAQEVSGSHEVLGAAEGEVAPRAASRPSFEPRHRFAHYGRDIFEEVERYAMSVVARFGRTEFDVIHGHDWMTFPAAIALAEVTGKPLVLHVHSLEHDRSGAHPNSQIAGIERWGLNRANAVIAVSYYTRRMIHDHYGVAKERISVVHNGVYPRDVVTRNRQRTGLPQHTVLFLGRITFQKGPDYFVEAAAKVIPHVPDVVFVMAGAGDMLDRLIRRVHELKIEKHFRFPGFLKGSEVEQMFSAADLYVMPSVSEPFGISALEAISYETPVIISRQSGVAEVLRHVLKVDFWDVEKLADLIINALLHEELRSDMVSMAREEVKRLHWKASAVKTIEVYRAIGAENGARAVVHR